MAAVRAVRGVLIRRRHVRCGSLRWQVPPASVTQPLLLLPPAPALVRSSSSEAVVGSTPAPAVQREAIFLAGMPGSGKSRIIGQRYGRRLVGAPGLGPLSAEERAQQLGRLAGTSADEFKDEDSGRITAILDLDREIISHPLYSPSTPAAIYDIAGAYEWADQRVEKRFLEVLADERISRVIIDGTGTKVARRAQRMQAARRAGFKVKILYVRVTLETAQRRNAKRNRVVPLTTLQDYERRLEASIRVGSGDADAVEILDNDVDAPPPD